MLSNNGINECIHYGELFTSYPEVIRTVSSRTDIDENLFLSAEDDVLMPTSDVTPNGLAKACCLKLRDMIIGGDVLVIRTDQQRIDGEFLARYIRRLEHRVLQLVTGSTVYHIYATSLEKLDLCVPQFAPVEYRYKSMTKSGCKKGIRLGILLPESRLTSRAQITNVGITAILFFSSYPAGI